MFSRQKPCRQSPLTLSKTSDLRGPTTSPFNSRSNYSSRSQANSLASLSSKIANCSKSSSLRSNRARFPRHPSRRNKPSRPSHLCRSPRNLQWNRRPSNICKAMECSQILIRCRPRSSRSLALRTRRMSMSPIFQTRHSKRWCLHRREELVKTPRLLTCQMLEDRSILSRTTRANSLSVGRLRVVESWRLLSSHW